MSDACYNLDEVQISGSPFSKDNGESMRKHKKKLIIASVILAVILFAGYLAYDIVSGYAFRLLTEMQLNEMLNEGEITLEELTPENTDDATEQYSAEQAEEPPGNLETQEETKDEGMTGEKPIVSPPAKPREQVVKEKAAEIQKTIPSTERAEIIKLVTSRLSSSDISYLMGLLSDGLTPEEKTAAKKIAYQKFNADEINRIRAYYRKYMGLIQ